MKYIPVWLKVLFALSFYPLIVGMLYPLDHINGLINKLLCELLFTLIVPTFLIPVSVCFVIQILTLELAIKGSVKKTRMELSKALMITYIALFAVSALLFIITFYKICILGE